MSHLTAPQRAAIRTDLLASRSELLAAVSDLAVDDARLAASQASGEDRPRSEGDGDSVTMDRLLVARLGDQARATLSSIDAALVRLDNGQFGLCCGCGGEIPFERLEFRPQSDACVPCASRASRR